MDKGFEYHRNFEGVWIPKEIYLDSALTATEKILYAEICSLDTDKSDGCYASNEYLAQFCQCSVRKISDGISKLIKRGYIYVSKNDGRKRYLRKATQDLRVCHADSASLDSKKRESNTQKMLQSNIDNNIFNNIDKDINAFRLLRKDRTYNNIKYYSNKDIYNKELYNNIYIRVIKSFIDRDIDNLEMVENLARIMEYFYYKYENVFGEPYTVLSNKAFETVVTEYLYPSEFLLSNEMFDFESHKQMIDRYFEVDYGRNNKSCAKIKLSLPHFMSSTIRENLAMQTQPMDNLSTSWTFA